ncbi:chromate efflux transporter [Shewanella ulleungensis]|jgi:chromate transporter|uniref:Chromate efflux pump n=1 Tax=Shewanella ulleungensis TaxID=2282699 RepID=A0ABQ2QRC2_9GAMM|nr:chromate efflux transporter [Shewanella ulleungensis]MCL1150517.1 chromate efflux transporter [Shewanella ulleungensis]GGP91798.1 chromate efflux pump [Shewanella ulleungensis]
MWQIFSRFLALGLISFGGPAAHIGYFRKTFVDDLQWLDGKQYASFVALSQFMPGPGSSQVGFAIGYHKGGLFGGLAAFLGFTLPSFLLLFLFAVTSAQWLEITAVQGVIHGLKLLAVVVVADATLSMFSQFCQRKTAKVLMAATAVAIILMPSMLMQIVVLIVAAIAGGIFLTRGENIIPENPPISLDYRWLALFILCLSSSLYFIGNNDSLGQIFAQFFQVGSLVFGGGHVVLPLLEASVGEYITPDRFLTGYALAQAIPGPMFTLATFLGADLWLESPILGAVVATLAIFLPGFLLMLVGLKSWHAISQRPNIAGALAGVNAAVVGLLLAALYQPVFTSAVIMPSDMAMVIIGFCVLKVFKPSIVWLVAGFASVGVILTLI